MKKFLFLLMTALTLFTMTGWSQSLRTAPGHGTTTHTPIFPVTTAENPCENCLDSVIVGEGTSLGAIPTNVYYKYSASQQIYTAEEIGDISGYIPCIAFQYGFSSPTSRNLTIYMGNTNKSSFTNETDWIDASELMLVFSGDINFSNTAPGSWVNIPLTTPFEYDGSSNIAVVVFDNTGSYISGGDRFATHSINSMSHYTFQDGSPYNFNNLSSNLYSNYVGTSRNNIRFMVGGAITCPSPSMLTVSEITSESATISWIEKEEHSSYLIAVIPADSTFDENATTIVVDSSYEANDLLPNTDYKVYIRAICSSDSSSYLSTIFRTACAPQTSLPYVVDFDGALSENELPYCSEIGLGNTDSDYPYVYDYLSHSGNASLAFSSYMSSMIRLPGLDLTENEQPLIMSFYEYKYTPTYGDVYVGYMTDLNNFSTFVTVKHVTADDCPADEWKQIRFGLPDSVNGRIIYPVFYSTIPYNSFNIDDVTISAGIEACFTPDNFAVDNVSYSSAQLTWTPVHENDNYIIAYMSDEDDEPSFIEDIPIGASSYMLTGLSSNSFYNVKLYPVCEGTPDTVTVSFLTLSNSVVTCIVPDTTLEAISIGTQSTSNSIPVNLYYKYSYTQQIFTAEEIGEATGLSSISFFYNYNTPSTSKTDVEIYLSLITDSVFANNNAWIPITTAVKVYEGPMSLTQGWNTFEFNSVFNYDGTSNLALIINDKSNAYDGYDYVFKTHIKTSNTNRTLYIYSDQNEFNTANPGPGQLMDARSNVRFTGCLESIEQTISCYEPTVFVSAYDSTHITLEWTPGSNESQWIIEYMAEGDEEWNTAATVSNTNSYTIVGLTSATNYQIRMRSVCSAADSSDWTTISAFTICEFASIPYFEDFETVSLNINGGLFSPCWFRGSSSDYYTPYIDTIYSSSGNKSLYLSSSYSDYSYAVFPRFENEVMMDSLTVKAKVFALYTGYSVDLGVMTNPTDFSSFSYIGSLTPSMSYEWQQCELSTNNYSGNGHFLAFRMPMGTYSTVYIDDVSVDYFNSCLHPTNITIDSITSETATLSWTPGAEETEWEYVYGPAGTVDLNEAIPQSTFDSTVIINNLTDHTDYDFYVRAVCDIPSDWEAFSFTTACLPLTELPYNQGFETMVSTTYNNYSGSSNLSDCWDAYNTGEYASYYPHVYYGSDANSGNYALEFYTYASSDPGYSPQYAFLPVLDPEAIPFEGLMLEFMMRTSYSGNTLTLVIGVTEGTDINTFVPMDTVTSNSTNYELKSVAFSGYEGNGNRIAIVAILPTVLYTSNVGFIDDIFLSAPTCIHPSDPEMTDHTTTSITLDWNERGDAGNWIIEYGPTGFDPGEGIMAAANEHPFTISDLTPSTSYDFYVRALCSDIDTSAYSNRLTASTECTNITLPYTETFESYSGTTFSDNHGVTPLCWTNISNNATYGAPHVIGSGTYYAVHSGQQSLIFTCGEAGSTAYAALPTFDAPLNTLSINFWRGMESTSYGTLTVGYVTNINSIDNSFVPVATIPSIDSDDDGDTITVEFTGEEIPEDGNICFRWVCTASFWSCFIDDIYVTSNGTTPEPPTPTLPTVTTVAADPIGQTTATLNATITNPDDVAITAKGFQWKVEGGEYQNAAGTGTGNDFSAELTNLTPSTQYFFKAYITTADTTVYGAELSFTTLPEDVDPCATPTGVTTSNITKESITVSWDNVEGVSWHVQYRQVNGTFASADASTNSYVITGLIPETTYEIQVQADCGNDNVSAWTEIVTATTLPDGVNHYLENSVVLYPNPAKEVVNVQYTMNNVQWDGATIEVLDVYGKLLQTLKADSEITSINVSNLANGMYFVRMTTEQGVVTKRFVKK